MGVIVVTGAANGMGRACVDRVRDLADTIVAVDLQAPDLPGCVGHATDISDPDSVVELAGAVAELGEFRGLINAAGISPTMGTPRRILEVDLVGTELLLQAFEPHVIAGSTAVCFASNSAHLIGAFAPDPEIEALVEEPLADSFLEKATARFDDSGFAYGWAKRGVIRSAARAAVRWGKVGGRVNSISPGIIATQMGDQELAAQPFMQTMVELAALGRVGEPGEVADVVAWLTSEGSSFVTGTDILVDGGCIEGLRAGGALG